MTKLTKISKEEYLLGQEQIIFVANTFSRQLKERLGLFEIQGPVITEAGIGIQDDLTGEANAVSFTLKGLPEKKFEVVHSLAKWKRQLLGRYQFTQGEGIFVNMKALRPCELLSHIHSVYVDQWDWEMVMPPQSRNLSFLKQVVTSIWDTIKRTELAVCQQYPSQLKPFLPENITFIHSEDLLAKYPNNTPIERENLITKEHGAVFLIGIGAKLSDGIPHDLRAPDYDDWSTINDDGKLGLNGDILVWNPVLNSCLELSSMGIRVDQDALLRQIKTCQVEEKLQLDWHQKLMNNEFPQTIGGGIGQSRVIMLLLQKLHIGQVHVGVWPKAHMDKHDDTLL